MHSRKEGELRVKHKEAVRHLQIWMQPAETSDSQGESEGSDSWAPRGEDGVELQMSGGGGHLALDLPGGCSFGVEGVGRRCSGQGGRGKDRARGGGRWGSSGDCRANREGLKSAPAKQPAQT